MAIDSAEKRRAALSVSHPGLLPAPDTSVEEGDRGMLAGVYRWFEEAVAAVTSYATGWLMRRRQWQARRR